MSLRGFKYQQQAKHQQQRRVNKHSGKNQHYYNYHFDLNFKGPAEEWMQRQQVGDIPFSKVAPGYVGRPLKGNDFWLSAFESPAEEGNAAALNDGSADSLESHLKDESQWPSLVNEETADIEHIDSAFLKGPLGARVDACTPCGEFISFNTYDGTPSALSATQGEEDWICLSPKALYSDALRAKQKASKQTKSEGASVVSSSDQWMLIDEDFDECEDKFEDQENLEDDETKSCMHVSLYEEEVDISGELENTRDQSNSSPSPLKLYRL